MSDGNIIPTKTNGLIHVTDEGVDVKIPYSKKNSNGQDEILLEPFTYLLRKKGKDIRPKLLQAFNVWLHVPEEKVRIIGEIIQMLHNASLLIDDIQDNSVLRRGNPCAHKIYGIASTINSANYVYFIGLEKILELGKPEAVTLFWWYPSFEAHSSHSSKDYSRSVSLFLPKFWYLAASFDFLCTRMIRRLLTI